MQRAENKRSNAKAVRAHQRPSNKRRRQRDGQKEKIESKKKLD